jgi:hypothetical protein
MTKTTGFRSFTAAAFAATAIFSAQPAAADVIELNNFWSQNSWDSNVNIYFTGTNWKTGDVKDGLQESGLSGGFLTYNLTTDPDRQNAFQSFCVNIFSSFSFAASSNDTQQPATIISAQAAADLGQLYTNHQAEINSPNSSAENESAFQLAVWEIVNEQGKGGYNLDNGSFRASGTGYSFAQDWLNELDDVPSSSNTASIWTVQSMISTGHGWSQDVVTFSPVQTPVPEPQTYAMMLVGLGLLGFSARRKREY